MNKTIIILLVSTITFISCKNTEQSVNMLDIAKQYYKALDQSDGAALKTLLSDSMTTTIPEYNYIQTYSQKDYVENWLKWDSAFEPTYEILQMEADNGMVKAKISKFDKRITLLNEKSFITNEILRFQNDKISSIETEYVSWDEKTWERNRTNLLKWIDENHPELNGFIFDQTDEGGKKFIKAIELYKNRK
ncbi:nuclear transport factor 2 family protein [Winogradskyella forsetii]|uniref:nuclear transport factor 2 family protein n=1 Tax=Winogradskyella forsetii TaxID=2686077 RepID=UPI0015B937DA|nr:hypothetical protein [Winogradskyella forsetii]